MWIQFPWRIIPLGIGSRFNLSTVTNFSLNALWDSIPTWFRIGMYVNWVFFCGKLFTNFTRTVGTFKFFVIVQPQYSWLIEWPFSEVVNWNENIVTKYYICYCCLLFYFSYASAVVHQWGFYHKVYFYLLFDVVILEKFVLRDVL